MRLLSEAREVDLLISDLSMPVMDGVELLQWSEQRFPRLPAILLTGLADDGVASALDRVLGGRCVIMRKPVSARTLLERVEHMLEAYETI